MGLPCIALVVADNQLPGSGFFRESGCGVVLDAQQGLDSGTFCECLSALLGDRQLRESCCDRGRALVDGKGAQRLVSALNALVADAAKDRV